MLRIAVVLIVLTLSAGAGRAGEAADLLTRHLYAGTLAEAERALAALPESAERQAGLGMARFVVAIEHLGQSLYRHGLRTPEEAVMINLPILRMPVPENPIPEPLDYEKFRAIFQTLVTDLDQAETALGGVGDQPVKLPIDLLRVRLDLDGDGKPSDQESLGAMLQGLAPPGMPVALAFDSADIYWLRGYSQTIAGFTQFVLAHDFRAAFDKTFHVFFPRAGLAIGKALAEASRPMMPGSDALGDVITFIHLINWPVIEPERLKDVRLRLKAVAGLSRRSWAAARAETDNDREWLPNAKQTGALAPLPVTDAVIDGWLAVMAQAELLLDGKLLVPHWRFAKGFDLKRYFEAAKSFDLVLLLAGTDALPFLADGPVTTDADWNALLDVFQGNFLGYAVWFN